VFFINGVWNDKEDAEASNVALQKAITAALRGARLDGSPVEFHPALTNSSSYLSDIGEVFFQIDRDTAYWNLDPAAKGLNYRREIDANRDKIYKALTGDSRGVVLVAHSQGNLFANDIFDELTTLGVDSSSMKIIGVGVPAPYLRTDEERRRYVTFNEDKIINSLRDTFELVRNARPREFLMSQGRKYIEILPATTPVGGKCVDFLGLCHGFADVYLGDQYAAKPIIIQNVVGALKELCHTSSKMEPLTPGLWQP